MKTSSVALALTVLAGAAPLVACGGVLHDSAAIHHDHPVRDSSEQREIVRHPDHGQSRIALQLLDQIDDFRLNGHVEGGGRLVGDEYARLAGEGHGDAHALPHAARELVRILAHALRRIGNSHLGQKLRGALLRVSGRQGEMQTQHFGDLAADGEHRIQRRQGILKHEGDFPAADASHLQPRLAEKIAANGPLALIASKEISNGGGDWTAEERWDEMARVMRPVFTSQDAQEGARAFAEKRAPVWKGQ